MKSKLIAIVAAMFAATPNANVLFLTSDNQAFTDKEKANNHSRYLSDKKVRRYERENYEQDEDEKISDSTTESERESLLVEYEELFGKTAAHNIGTETLKQRIEAKKAEVSQNPIKENEDTTLSNAEEKE